MGFGLYGPIKGIFCSNLAYLGGLELVFEPILGFWAWAWALPKVPFFCPKVKGLAPGERAPIMG